MLITLITQFQLVLVCTTCYFQVFPMFRSILSKSGHLIQLNPLPIHTKIVEAKLILSINPATQVISPDYSIKIAACKLRPPLTDGSTRFSSRLTTVSNLPAAGSVLTATPTSCAFSASFSSLMRGRLFAARSFSKCPSAISAARLRLFFL